MEQLVMEVSEDESVADDVRKDESEYSSQNRMDFEQEPEENLRSVSPLEMEPNTNPELTRKIQIYEMKKQKYEEILKNQVANIVELQNACEGVACVVQQLPILKEQNFLRFNQVMNERQGIKEKHLQLNELIEFTIQIYDENMKHVYAVKENFAEQQRMNEERRTVFEMDVEQFPKMGNDMNTEIEARIKTKREYCWLLNNYLAEVSKSQMMSQEVDEKIDKAFMDAHDLSKELLQCESQLEIKRKDNERLKVEIQNEEIEFTEKLEYFRDREAKCEEELTVLRQKLDEAHLQLQTLLTNKVQLEGKYAERQETIRGLENEKREKEAAQSSLVMALEELENQKKVLSESLDVLEKCRRKVSDDEEEIKSLEEELQQQTTKSKELNDQREELERQIVEIENVIEEALKRNSALEEDYRKMAPDIEYHRINLRKGRAELDSSENKMQEKFHQVQSEVEKIDKKLSENNSKVEEWSKKFNDLQHHNDILSGSVKEKRASIADMEEQMRVVNEELDQSEVELNELNEKLKIALELKNQVDHLEKKMSDAKEELAQMDDLFNNQKDKINETGSKQIEMAMKEMENRKQEYVTTLDEKTKEMNALEEQFKTLQAALLTNGVLLKDATKLSDVCSCELSLLTSFANWVCREETTFPQVTSTSEDPVSALQNEPDVTTANESQNDFYDDFMNDVV